jgi:hypothetical protein
MSDMVLILVSILEYRHLVGRDRENSRDHILK